MVNKGLVKQLQERIAEKGIVKGTLFSKRHDATESKAECKMCVVGHMIDMVGIDWDTVLDGGTYKLWQYGGSVGSKPYGVDEWQQIQTQLKEQFDIDQATLYQLQQINDSGDLTTEESAVKLIAYLEDVETTYDPEAEKPQQESDKHSGDDDDEDHDESLPYSDDEDFEPAFSDADIEEYDDEEPDEDDDNDDE